MCYTFIVVVATAIDDVAVVATTFSGGDPSEAKSIEEVYLRHNLGVNERRRLRASYVLSSSNVIQVRRGFRGRNHLRGNLN